MQVNGAVEIASRGDSVVELMYAGDEVWCITVNGEGAVTLTREELYDICQVVFARKPAP